MHGNTNALLPVIFTVFVILSSGCIGLDPQALAMANPLIKEFLDEHPNAEIQITHFNSIAAENILEEIRSDCNNPYIGAKEYYRVRITDPDTDFYALVWIDWESKIVECALKLGTVGKETDNPKEDEGCEHHAEYICKSGHIYWFDSCGNKEDKKEYCPKGCLEENLECNEEESCKSHYEYKCKGDHLYWFDSCGHVEEKKEYCEHGCEDGRCIDKNTCEEMDGYCMYTTYDSAAASDAYSSCKEGYVYGNYWCPNSGMCCIPEQIQCQPHHEYKCYDGHVYWLDSCGNREDKKEYCDYGCENNECLAEETCSEEWVCTDWGECDGGQQTRTCEDLNECGTEEGKPYDVKECQPEGSIECYDSDSTDEYTDGKNYNQKGYVEAGEQYLEDYCNSDGTLNEFFCENGELKWENHKCERCEVGDECCKSECRKGICIEILCHPSWQFSEWSSCYDGLQTREVWDDGYCGGGEIPNCTLYMPVDSKPCEYIVDVTMLNVGKENPFKPKVFPHIYENIIVFLNGYAGNVSIYDISTGEETQITHDRSFHYHPIISGDKIVWLERKYKDFLGDAFHEEGNVFMYDLSIDQKTMITDNIDTYRLFSDIDMDEERIVWSDNRNGNYDIFMYETSTGQEIQMTDNPTNQRDPAISGDKIAFVDDRNGNWDIYLYDISTDKETRITDDLSAQRSVDIYDDVIAWVDERNRIDSPEFPPDSNYDIYMYDLSTDKEIQLPSDIRPTDEHYPQIYENKIVYTGDLSGYAITSYYQRDIYLYDTTTGITSQITSNLSRSDKEPSIYGNRIVWLGIYGDYADYDSQDIFVAEIEKI